MADNLLYYGDNLDILRRYVEDERVDLFYLDPPFRSNQDDWCIRACSPLSEVRRRIRLLLYG